MACNLYKMHLLFPPRAFLLNLFLSILHTARYLNSETVLLALLCSVESRHKCGIWYISNILHVIITFSYLLVSVKHKLPVLTSKIQLYLQNWQLLLLMPTNGSFSGVFPHPPSSPSDLELKWAQTGISVPNPSLFLWCFHDCRDQFWQKTQHHQKTSPFRVPAVLNHHKYIPC